MAGPRADRQRIAFAGEHGSFAEDAVDVYFPGAEAVPVPSFRDVFETVQGAKFETVQGAQSETVQGSAPAGESDPQASPAAGVVPIENLVTGTVREVYDLLLEHQLTISGEVVVPVRLCLAALRGERLEEIERVYSHTQALGQAELFLRSRPWQLLTTYNTAGAGRLIAERKERGAAAVLSSRAAALFKLKVLAEDIQDVAGNRTRFIVVGPSVAEPETPAGELPMRTTLVFSVRNEPGSLHRALAVIAAAGLNMSKIESRPSRNAAWEYVFWVDLDADVRGAATRMALAELEGVTTMLRILGCYAQAPQP
jgi:prephenate dehydratase